MIRYIFLYRIIFILKKIIKRIILLIIFLITFLRYCFCSLLCDLSRVLLLILFYFFDFLGILILYLVVESLLKMFF